MYIVLTLEPARKDWVFKEINKTKSYYINGCIFYEDATIIKLKIKIVKILLYWPVFNYIA